MSGASRWTIAPLVDVAGRTLDLSLGVGAARLVVQGRIRPLPPMALLRFARERLSGLAGGPYSILRLHALAQPDALALIEHRGDESVRLSWGELGRRVNRLAEGLLSIGVGPRDRVALLMHNSHEYLELAAALGFVGASSVQIGYKLKAAEIAHLLGDSGAKALFVHPEYLGVAREAAALAGTLRADQVYVCTRDRAVDGARFEEPIPVSIHEIARSTVSSSGTIRSVPVSSVGPW